MLIVSDSNPIQFWPIVDDTFNEEDKDSQYIEEYFFYLQFENEDNIKLQAIEQPVNVFDSTFDVTFDFSAVSYKLAIYDEDGNLITRLPFIMTFVFPYYVYNLTFSALGIGVSNGCFKCVIESDSVIITTVEDRVSIEEFAVDMDGWVNQSFPSTTLAALSTFLNHDNVITPGGLGDAWSNVGGFPYVELSGGGSVSKWAYIDLSGSNDHSYKISFKVDYDSTSPPATPFHLQFIYLDSIFNPLDSADFDYPFTSSAPGSKTGTFITPSGIGPIKYIALRISLTAATTGILSFHWVEANLIVPAEADWFQSSDNGGSLKLITLNTVDDSTIIKSSITLPSLDHFIRFKWQSNFATVNAGLVMEFKILNSSSAVIASYLLPVPTSALEQVYTVHITDSTVKSNASKFLIHLVDISGNFLSGDTLHINSIEIYTTSEVVSDVFTPIYKSDIIEATDLPLVNTLLSYKTNKEFDGILASTDYFNIRIPGRLYHAIPKGDQKIQELSNGVYITTYASLSKAKRLQVDDLPDYMHEKIKSILMFCVTGSLLINGVEWELATGDSYAYTDSRPDTYPMNPAEVTLTRKNYTKHNVI